MNKFKKFIAIAACAAMVLSFAACGGNGGEETTTAQKTTVAETTTSPLTVVETRFSVPASMNVWTKGEKVTYKDGETKIMTVTASLNDSVSRDKFSKSKSTADFKALKKSGSCVEIFYDKDQTAAFFGEKVIYDQVVVATSGDNMDIIYLLKDSALAGAIKAEKGEQSKKSVSENVLSAVEVIVHEDHTH